MKYPEFIITTAIVVINTMIAQCSYFIVVSFMVCNHRITITATACFGNCCCYYTACYSFYDLSCYVTVAIENDVMNQISYDGVDYDGDYALYDTIHLYCFYLSIYYFFRYAFALTISHLPFHSSI